MFERFAEIGRKKTVANELNKAGYRTRNGGKFSPSTVGRLLQDPAAKGLHRTELHEAKRRGLLGIKARERMDIF